MITIDALRAYGANVDEGLRRCMNMEAFYLKLFGSLKGDTRVDDLKAAVARKDLDAAFEAAHALKGSIGNVSLTPIYKPICELTDLLRGKNMPADGGRALLEQIVAQGEKALRL